MRRSVRKHRQIVAAAARRPYAGLRLAVTLLALITFGFQSYLVQTHIHGLPHSVVAASDQHASSASSQKAPIDRGELKCPLCQDSVRAGNYLLPAAISALPPTLVVKAILVNAASLSASKAISHIWQSRGPPLA